jgi:hypothetical protein
MLVEDPQTPWLIGHNKILEQQWGLRSYEVVCRHAQSPLYPSEYPSAQIESVSHSACVVFVTSSVCLVLYCIDFILLPALLVTVLSFLLLSEFS